MKRVLVTGGNGLVGSAVKALAHTYPYDFVFVGRQDADLTDQHQVEALFELVKPNYVLHASAKVGGLGGNLCGPADYFYQNILMNSFVLHNAWKYGVEKLLAFSSVCVFPDGIPVLREDLMHGGEPYPSQYAYAAAKRAIDTQIKAYKSQHGIRNFTSIIPCNIFGENDYYNLVSGHVLPSLIHKVFLAKLNDQPLRVWGDGSATREFIYSQDLARIVLQIMALDDIPQRVIVSNPQQVSIRRLVEKLCAAANFKGEVVWETDKPNGQKCRPSDISLLKSLVGEPEFTDIDAAVKKSYDWFEANHPGVRL